LKPPFLTKLPGNDVYLKLLVAVCLLTLVATAVWVGGPYIAWGDNLPLAPPEKRIYLIIFLFLIWLLKFLVFDLDAPNPFHYKDAQTRIKLQALQKRFRGAVEFLRKTTVSRQGSSLHLNQLPWYLLMGPPNAGKTTLLANSDVNFILQRRFHQDSPQNSHQDLQASDNCDWWVTRDASIIDVPGKYLAPEGHAKNNQKARLYPTLWAFFLRLIKKQRGKNGIDGIIIALPLPEIMKQESDTKKYQLLMRDLFQRLHDVQKIFPRSVPCYLVITKCDLLSGFSEFFAESGNDELAQAWGVKLPQPKHGEKIHDVFTHQFNSLIKKLNQQLLWRLHQERNPMARPYIKDFPLQVERLKEFAFNFIKKFSVSQAMLSLQGVYLTSALQTKPEDESNVLDNDTDTTQRAVQLFQEPALSSRTYFVKQLITHGFVTVQSTSSPLINTPIWKRRAAYAASISVITGMAIILGKDFEQGIKQAYSIQHNLSDYQLASQQIQDPDEHILQTLNLLNALRESAKNTEFKLDISHLMSFYSNKSHQKANIVYQQALQTILLPEIKNYLEEALKNPVNKNTESLYATLKAYLMLGDSSHFQAEYISNTIRQILPKSMDASLIDGLIIHINLALTSISDAMPLDPNLIQQTRRFLLAIPNYQLAYILLKNINSNNNQSDINLGTETGTTSVLISRTIKNQIPLMFTSKAFSTIISQEAAMAAAEATMGNWILGDNVGVNKSLEMANALADQLRTTYVTNYIEVWESLLANIQLSAPKDLAQADAMIIDLISNDSPLLQLLQTLHDNTYFEPIASSSPKLQSLGLLLEKNNQPENLLYEIFTSLQSLHQYVQSILSADNEKKAAFEAVSKRMLHNGTPDAITQLMLIAEKAPDPVRNWLDHLANDTWRFLIQDASHYLDFTWQNQVSHVYENKIANRYPFNTNTREEVELQSFIDFFGNPGIVTDFYYHYLQPFIDTSSPDWRWKMVNNHKLPFTDETLRQIQQAIRIHRTFFPNADTKLYVQFALQPFKFGKFIKRVKLNINNKQIIDERNGPHSPHLISWPDPNKSQITSIQLTMMNKQTINRHFSGHWGWFKMINESFESIVTKKEIMLNLSMNEQPVNYLLFTAGQYNPFLSLNLRHFHLPQQLTNEKA
jgi:type VI secretion system protein ImpL